MEHESVPLLADAHTWVLFSAILFAIVAWKKGKAPLLSMLDGRTARIKSQLEEAERLRNEAEALLAEYRQKRVDAVETAKKIIENAKEAAILMEKDAERKLEENVRRRETLLLERIARAEAAAVQEIRHQAADLAAAAAEQLLAGAMSRRGAKLVEEAISELPKRAN